MAIDDLAGVVPPPDEPIEAGNDRKWKRVVARLQLELPKDLYDFGVAYGTGTFCNGFLKVYNPFSKEYSAVVKADLGRLERAKILGIEVPYQCYPSEPGLFPWGSDENGTGFFWLTEGASHEWPTISQRGEHYQRWDLAMTSFLAQMLMNRLKSSMWKEPFKKSDRVFTPET